MGTPYPVTVSAEGVGGVGTPDNPLKLKGVWVFVRYSQTLR